MTNDVRMIMGALDLMHSACEKIHEYGDCAKCPIRAYCFEDTSPLDIAENVTAGQFEEFLGLADDVQEWLEDQEINSEENQKALYADWQRKYEAEERMIDEEWGY